MWWDTRINSLFAEFPLVLRCYISHVVDTALPSKRSYNVHQHGTPSSSSSFCFMAGGDRLCGALPPPSMLECGPEVKKQKKLGSFNQIRFFMFSPLMPCFMSSHFSVFRSPEHFWLWRITCFSDSLVCSILVVLIKMPSCFPSVPGILPFFDDASCDYSL